MTRPRRSMRRPHTGTKATPHTTGRTASSTSGLLLCVLAKLIIGCATTEARVTPEPRAEISKAADACMRDYPIIDRYEIDQWGGVTAWYRQNMGQTQGTATDPFFDCMKRRLGGGGKLACGGRDEVETGFTHGRRSFGRRGNIGT